MRGEVSLSHVPRGLQSLSLNCCPALSADSLSAAALHCGVSLRRLSIDHCRVRLDKVADALAHLVHLEELSFCCYNGYTDYGRPEFSINFVAALAEAPHLRILLVKDNYAVMEDLVCCYDTGFSLLRCKYTFNLCTLCPLKIVQLICRSCPQLTHLSIGPSSRLHDVTEQALKHLVKLQKLKSLDVCKMENVTDNSIAAFSALKNLEVALLISYI